MSTQSALYTEDIIYQAQIHWIAYVKLWFFIIIGFPFLIFFPISIIMLIKSMVLLPIIICVGAIILLLKSVYRYCFLKKMKIYLTQRFLSLQTGVFSSQTNDIALSKLEGMSVNQSTLGRILDYGTLVVSTGEIRQSYFIKNPQEFRRQLLQSINLNYENKKV